MRPLYEDPGFTRWCQLGACTPTERSENGADETPLHVAGITGEPEVIQMLVDAGADVNARTAGGQYLQMQPLHWVGGRDGTGRDGTGRSG